MSARTASALLATAMLIPGAPARAKPVDAGPPLPRMTGTIPTLLDHNAVAPADLDGDGADEFLVIGRDGVAHRYDADGTFRWAVSTIEIAFRAGAVAVDGASSFEGDYRGRASSCTTDHGVALADRNGDGVRDVLLTTWIQLAEPTIEQRSLIVELDGKTGGILDVHRLEGWVTSLDLRDLDADGDEDLLVVEEDGAVEQLTAGDGRVLVRGTGGTTRVHAYDLGTWSRLWSHDTGRGWAQVASIADVEGDVALSITGPTTKPLCGAVDPGGPSGQDLRVLEASTGDIRWSVAAPSFIEELLSAPDRLIVLSRSASGSSVTARDPASGAAGWTAALPAGARVWDIATDGGDVLAAYARGAETPGAEEQGRFARITGATGALAQDVLVDGGTTPAAASEVPTIGRMRLAIGDLDGVGAAEVAVRTDRTLSMVDATGRVRWQRRAFGGRNVLFVSRDGASKRLWAQGPIPKEAVPPPDRILYSREHAQYHLIRLDAIDGGIATRFPMLGNAVGLVRVDVNDDGIPDRIAGGTGEALVAFDGSSQRVLWTRLLDAPVLDLELADVDRDGKPDLLVEGHLTVFAVDARDGRVEWTYRHDPTLGSGRWSAFEIADLTGDGVRDVVLGTSTGVDGGLNLVENPHVVLLDGTTGVRVWQRLLPPPVKRVNGLDVGDVNRDGVPDVGLALEALGAPWLYSVAMLDGTNGVPMWAENQRNHPGGRATAMDAARMLDADGDGDQDLAVATAGDQAPGGSVRAHDGATGAELWFRALGSVGIPGGWEGLFDGPTDPAGRPTLLATHKVSEGLSGSAFVHGIGANGASLFVQFVPTPLIWQLEVGDVTGDGVEDIVTPWIRGFGVIDGAGALAGEPRILGHLEERFPSKAKLFDVDGDGTLEIETLVTPNAWPLHIGHNALLDVTVPSKAIGTIDLGDAG